MLHFLHRCYTFCTTALLSANQNRVIFSCILLVRWPTSALRMPNDSPNSKPYSEFLNLTPNSKTSLQIQTSLRIHKTHSEFKNLTPNSKISLRILEPHSKFQKLTPNSKTPLRIQKNWLRIQKPHSEFKNITPNSKNSLRILEPVSIKHGLRTTDHGLRTTDCV